MASWTGKRTMRADTRTSYNLDAIENEDEEEEMETVHVDELRFRDPEGNDESRDKRDKHVSPEDSSKSPRRGGKVSMAVKHTKTLPQNERRADPPKVKRNPAGFHNESSVGT